MTRITLDTNEWVGAFNFGGQALSVIHGAIAGDVEIAISEPILQETLRVLREKFDWQPYRLHALAERLRKICIVVDPKQTETVLADEPDNRILECAKESASDSILTEDGAMLRLKSFHGIPIMTMREFLGRGSGR